MKTIITIQHTQSVQHLNGMIGSWTDWELTELGRSQAENIGRSLSARLSGKQCRLFCSDLLRTKQTAQPLANRLGVEIEYREDLREINFGEACGKSKQWAKENRLPVKSFDDPEYAGAESWRVFLNRVSAAMDDILTADAEVIIVVSHTGTLKAFQTIWAGNPLSFTNEFGKPGGVSFYTIDDNGTRTAQCFSDMTYCEEG